MNKEPLPEAQGPLAALGTPVHRSGIRNRQQWQAALGTPRPMAAAGARPVGTRSATLLLKSLSMSIHGTPRRASSRPLAVAKLKSLAMSSQSTPRRASSRPPAVARQDGLESAADSALRSDKGRDGAESLLGKSLLKSASPPGKHRQRFPDPLHHRALAFVSAAVGDVRRCRANAGATSPPKPSHHAADRRVRPATCGGR